jgi:hypothetical protein
MSGARPLENLCLSTEGHSNPFAHLDPAHVPLSIPVSSYDFKHRGGGGGGGGASSLNTRWRILHDTWTNATLRSKQKREALERAEPPPPPAPPQHAAPPPQFAAVAQNFFDTLSAQGNGFSQVIRQFQDLHQRLEARRQQHQGREHGPGAHDPSNPFGQHQGLHGSEPPGHRVFVVATSSMSDPPLPPPAARSAGMRFGVGAPRHAYGPPNPNPRGSEGPPGLQRENDFESVFQRVRHLSLYDPYSNASLRNGGNTLATLPHPPSHAEVENCPICLDNDRTVSWTQFPCCKNYGHETCTRRALQRDMRCPICRTRIP